MRQRAQRQRAQRQRAQHEGAVIGAPATPTPSEGADERQAGQGHPTSARVRRRSEFRRIQSQGRRVHTAHFIIILQPRRGIAQRLGITVTKKVGSAVGRNRVKRLVREVFRRNRKRFPRGCDFVVIAKRGAPTLAYADVLDEVSRAERALRSAAQKARARDEQRGVRADG